MESSIYTGAFWKAAAERAVKTFAQTAVASLTRITSYNVCYTKLLRVG